MAGVVQAEFGRGRLSVNVAMTEKDVRRQVHFPLLGEALSDFS
jgi:hypothetical protein